MGVSVGPNLAASLRPEFRDLATHDGMGGGLGRFFPWEARPKNEQRTTVSQTEILVEYGCLKTPLRRATCRIRHGGIRHVARWKNQPRVDAEIDGGVGGGVQLPADVDSGRPGCPDRHHRP